MRAPSRLRIRYRTKAGIEFPHIGSEALGNPEHGQCVPIGMGAGAAMANAEWAFDNVHRPTITSDKLSDQRLESSIRLSPSCLHHRRWLPHGTD